MKPKASTLTRKVHKISRFTKKKERRQKLPITGMKEGVTQTLQKLRG